MRRIVVVFIILSLLTGFFISASGCKSTVTGSGNLETRDFDYSDFSRVEIGSAFKATISRGDSYQVSITLDDNAWDYLEVSQKGDTLYIRLKQPVLYIHVNQQTSITLPLLKALSLSGASRGEVAGFDSQESLELNISGASTLDIANMKAGNTEFDVSGASRLTGNIVIEEGKFDISGASTVDLDGSGHDMDIAVSGASHVKLADFTVVDTEVELSGASSASINVSGRLDINLSGASRLEYSGNPVLGSVDISGASTMKKK